MRPKFNTEDLIPRDQMGPVETEILDPIDPTLGAATGGGEVSTQPVPGGPIELGGEEGGGEVSTQPVPGGPIPAGTPTVPPPPPPPIETIPVPPGPIETPLPPPPPPGPIPAADDTPIPLAAPPPPAPLTATGLPTFAVGGGVAPGLRTNTFRSNRVVGGGADALLSGISNRFGPGIPTAPAPLPSGLTGDTGAGSAALSDEELLKAIRGGRR